ncbi:MAG TPA: hypothetical protein VNT51_11430 [Miltoncostaeaceae bacterium]|nr:hypothetical protein [Miltoncostaeaceae bacterium]
MSDPSDPREVLAAVRRMEAELDELRLRTRRAATALDTDALRAAIAADAAEERRRVVEDLETVVELIATAWRSAADGTARLADDVRGLRDEVAALRSAMEHARLEVRFGQLNGNGSGV